MAVRHWLAVFVQLAIPVFVVLGPGFAIAAPDDGQVRRKLAGLRVPFIANEGQVDAKVAYYAPTFAGTLFVTQRGELVYALPGRTSGSPHGRRGTSPGPGWTLTETLRGSLVRPVGQDRSATGVSYFIGRDATRWRPEVPTYEQVGLGEVWPGVTVSLRARGNGIEKVFTVAPGASVDRIRVRVAGARTLAVDPAGALVARTGLGPVTFTAPVAYQERDGVRHLIAVAYRLKGREYRFAVGAYDRSVPLVIDPLLQSTYLGAGGDDRADALAIHPMSGDVYVAGQTFSSNFPGTSGGAQPAFGGYADAFVARLNGALTALTQATYLGGGEGDAATALAIHPTSGDVYVAGFTYVAVSPGSFNFPGTSGGAQPAASGNGDAFVARLNSALTALTQATYLGGGDVDRADALAIHPTSGDVYVAGQTSSTNFPGTSGGAQPAAGGLGGAFVARLNSALTALTQATYLGGSNDHAFALAIHPTGGDVYVAGFTASTDFPGTSGGAQPAAGGNGDAFVARLNSALTALTQATYLGGSNGDFAKALAIHPTSGDVYVAGFTRSTNFPGTSGGAQPAFVGNPDIYPDAFVARLNSALTALTQATYLGGSDYDNVSALAIHPMSGGVYVAGQTFSTNFPGTSGGAQPAFGGYADAFVARLNSALTALTQATYLGGSNGDYAYALAIHPTSGDVYVAGLTGSTNFPGTSGGAQPASGGNGDAFVVRLPSSLALVEPVISATPASLDFGSVALGSTKDLNFSVQNIGGGMLSGSASVGVPFSVVAGSPFSLAAGETKAVSVRFAPTSEALFTSNVSVTSTGGNGSVAVQGTGGNRPSAPTLLAPSNGATNVSTAPPFSWTAVSGNGATGAYRIQVATNAADLSGDPGSSACGASCVINTISSTTSFAPLTTLANGTAYTWQAHALGNSLGGIWSDRSTFTTLTVASDKSDLVIQNLSVTPNTGATGSSVTVRFDIRNQGLGIAQPSTTRVRFAISGTAVTTSDTLLASLSTPSILPQSTVNVATPVFIPSVTAGSYFVWVIADVNGTANQSNPANDKANAPLTVMPPAVLPKPALIKPADGSAGVSTLAVFTWSPVVGASSYRIMVATSQAALPTDAAADTCPACAINDPISGASYTTAAGALSPGATYFWQVKARSSTQVGAWSRPLFSFTAATPAAGPMRLDFLDPVAGNELQRPSIDTNGHIVEDRTILAKLDTTVGGASADGVTRLILRVETGTRIRFALSSDKDGCITALSNQQACDAGGTKTQVDVDPVSADSKSFAFALYVTPDGLGGDRLFRHIEVTIAAPPEANPIAHGLTLWWPAVVLVHGIWGDDKTWGQFAKELCGGLEDKPPCVSGSAWRLWVTRWKYVPNDSAFSNTQTFRENVPVSVLHENISSVRSYLQSMHIAAAQVDVIGHSMGGLVARAYSEYSSEYRKPDNFRRGYIHKLITVDTPHFGTALADWIRDKKLRKDCDPQRPFGPAIDDLRSIGPHLTPGTTIPTHAIVTVSPLNTKTERYINERLFGCSTNPDSTPPILSPITIIHDVLDGDGNHDTVVTKASQGGRGSIPSREIPPSQALGQSIVHSGKCFPPIVCDVSAPDARAIRDWLLFLLNKPTADPLFSTPESLAASARAGGTTEFAETQPRGAEVLSRETSAASSTHVVDPAPGTFVIPGQDVLIRLSPLVGGAAFARLTFSVGDGIALVETAPFEIVYRVSSDAAGRIDIDVRGFDVNGGRVSGGSYVLVSQTAVLQEIHLAPSQFIFTTQGTRLNVRVDGLYDDGVTRNITSAGTTYRTLSGSSQVVEITDAGVIVSTGPGSDVVLVENAGVSAALSVIVVGSFADIALDHVFLKWIEALFKAGITGGCATSPLQYCADSEVTRGQMAVFLLRGIHGSGYQPPDATGLFTDVASTHLFVKWIEELAREGITGGCSASPPQYCPEASVTRGQMAVFLLRAKHGAGYQPPAATGMFADVPTDHLFALWIEQLAREGITGGCGTNPARYCPEDPVTRGQMAVFLVRAFNLPL